MPLDPGSSEQFYRQKQHSKRQQALQAPRVQFPSASKHSPWQKPHSMWQRHPADPCGVSPCCSRRGFSIFSNRISTCNIHSSTKVSGLQIHFLFLFLHILENPRSFILFWKILVPSGQNFCSKASKRKQS